MANKCSKCRNSVTNCYCANSNGWETSEGERLGYHESNNERAERQSKIKNGGYNNKEKDFEYTSNPGDPHW